MQEIPTVQQPTQVPQQPPIYQQQPPMYPPHPYREYAAVEQPYYGQPYYGPPPVPPKRKMAAWKKWGIGVLAFMAFLLVALVGGVIVSMLTPTEKTAPPVATQQPATVVPTPKPTPVVSEEDQYKASAKTMTVAEFVDAGDAHKGGIVHVTGMVVLTVVSSNGTPGVQIADWNVTGKFLYVLLPKGTNLHQLQPGDSLEMWGMSLGTVQSQGKTISGMNAVYFTDLNSGYKN